MQSLAELLGCQAWAGICDLLLQLPSTHKPAHPAETFFYLEKQSVNLGDSVALGDSQSMLFYSPIPTLFIKVPGASARDHMLTWTLGSANFL